MPQARAESALESQGEPHKLQRNGPAPHCADGKTETQRGARNLVTQCYIFMQIRAGSLLTGERGNTLGLMARQCLWLGALGHPAALAETQPTLFLIIHLVKRLS